MQVLIERDRRVTQADGYVKCFRNNFINGNANLAEVPVSLEPKQFHDIDGRVVCVGAND